MPENEQDLKASLTYHGKTVDMDDKSAAEGLIKDMITETFPEFKGGKMPGVRIELKRVEGINLKPKNNKVIISMEAYMSPGDIARLFNIAGQGVPMQAVIESPQAEFDLIFNEINTFTGEIKLPKEPALSAKGPDSRD
jgi:hypothetical protein